MKSNDQIRGQNSFQENRKSESDSQSLEMSSDKNLDQKCVSNNSHSFDDRICDDLSEVLLQFLPLKHKVRLDCVSKQFQRTVFQKQCKITLVSSIKMNINNEIEYENKIPDKVSEKHYRKSCLNPTVGLSQFWHFLGNCAIAM